MEQRRTRRFKLQLPLSITRSGADRAPFAGHTNNLSSSGVLFTAEREPELGGAIEYVITLNHEGSQSVNLRCMGKVLRTDRMQTGDDPEGWVFQVAATLERYEFVRVRGDPMRQPSRATLGQASPTPPASLWYKCVFCFELHRKVGGGKCGTALHISGTTGRRLTPRVHGESGPG
jgi:hypothetical protein